MAGSLPSDWRVTTLGDCASWYSGGTPRTSVADYWDGDIPWITASSLQEFYIQDSERRVTQLGLENGTRLMPKDSILFVVRGMSLKTEFRIGIARRPVAFGQDCKAIVVSDGIDPLYLANVLRAKSQAILGIVDEASHGTGRLQTGALQRLEIPVPPLAEQQGIAHILGTLDDKIELNRRMNVTLEGMAQAIFKSSFVDFDPVRAKAAGEQPLGLAPHIADLFPAAFEESELGEIPKGWEVCAVSELAQINEHVLAKADSLDSIDYVEISKVMRGEISETVRYERGTEPSRARRRLRHGDTVLSTVRPDRGAHFLCLDPPKTLIASTGFAVLSPKDGYWALLYTALTRREIGETLGRLADGGAYPAIRPEVVGSLTMAIPGDPQLMQEFERIAEPLYQKAERNRDQCRSLAALRDTLLPRLISGELRVPTMQQGSQW